MRHLERHLALDAFFGYAATTAAPLRMLSVESGSYSFTNPLLSARDAAHLDNIGQPVDLVQYARQLTRV